jgi:hypothetical protein
MEPQSDGNGDVVAPNGALIGALIGGNASEEVTTWTLDGNAYPSAAKPPR